jgi:hypothetical protein
MPDFWLPLYIKTADTCTNMHIITLKNCTQDSICQDDFHKIILTKRQISRSLQSFSASKLYTCLVNVNNWSWQSSHSKSIQWKFEILKGWDIGWPILEEVWVRKWTVAAGNRLGIFFLTTLPASVVWKNREVVTSSVSTNGILANWWICCECLPFHGMHPVPFGSSLSCWWSLYWRTTI